MNADEVVSYKYRIASDVIRDGVGLELWKEPGNFMIVEVFYSDDTDEMTFAACSGDGAKVEWEAPLSVIEDLISEARRRLIPRTVR